MTDFWNLSQGEKFTYVFNRTTLGVGVLVALYSFYVGDVLRGFSLFLLVPVYFYLSYKFDAP